MVSLYKYLNHGKIAMQKCIMESKHSINCDIDVSVLFIMLNQCQSKA